MKTIKALTLATLFFVVGNAHGQTTKTQQPQTQSDWDDNDTDKPVRFNYVIDDPMDKFGPQSQTNQVNLRTTVYNVPEFYFPQPKKIKDTTFKFLCYDSRDTLIPDVKDFDQVYYYSLFKEYNDPVQTYLDNGVRKPLPVSFIMKRFDRIAKDKWMIVEYPGNKYSEWKGDRNIIVRTDTLGVYNPTARAGVSEIFKYYKVTKN